MQTLEVNPIHGHSPDKWNGSHGVRLGLTAAPWLIVLPNLGAITKGQKNLCWILGSLSTWMGGDLTRSGAQLGK